MDIHFSDEEDYNSDIDDSTLWEEELEIKAGAGKKKNNESKKDNTEAEGEGDAMEEEMEEVDKDLDDDIDKETVEVNSDDEDMEMEGDDMEAEMEGDDIEAEEEYYPEEDAGEKEEIIVAMEDRITSDILSKYEIVELISIRATQISKGDKPFTDVASLRNPNDMAKKELYDNRCPLLVKRNIGNNMYEYWNPNYMSKPKI